MNGKPENLVMKNVTRMRFKNFSGKATQKNNEGNRNFSIIIPEDLAQQLNEEGWNVRYREIDDQWLLKVHVSYQYKKPDIKTITTNSKVVTRITERTVDQLDWASIESYDVNIEASNKTYLNGEGRETHSAYLQSMNVYVTEDPIANMWQIQDEVPYEEE